MTRPRLLFLAPASPAPDGNGLAMRAFLFLSAYAERFEVDLAVVPIAGPPLIDARAAALCGRCVLIPPEGVDSHFALVRGVSDSEGRLAAFAAYSGPSIAAGLTVGVHARLKAFAGQEPYALVHVARSYLAGLAAPFHGNAPTVLDCDEADGSVIAAIARLQRRAGAIQAARWSMIEAAHFDRAARQALPRFDLRLAASSQEARRLGTLCPGAAVKTLVNPAPQATGLRRATLRLAERVILTVGTMSYPPNAEGVTWFARQILPRIQAASREPVRLVIAGRAPTAAVRRLGSLRGVTVTGEVADLAPLYRRADLVVAPLRAGGGTRIKLLEAAAAGRPAVSTRIGAEGLGLRHGRDLLLADTPSDFAGACLRLMARPGLARRLAANARQAVGRDHDARRLKARILALVAPLVAA